MRSKLSIIVCMIVACFAACSAGGKSEKAKTMEKPGFCARWNGPDSIAYSHLGRNLSTVLFSPQEVKVYRVSWTDSIENGQLEPNFTRDALIAKLSKEEIAALQFCLLSDSNNFVKDSIVVMSPYIPVLDFEFRKKKEVAHVLVSLSDFTWTIIYDDKKQFNYNYHSNAIDRLSNFYLNKP